MNVGTRKKIVELAATAGLEEARQEEMKTCNARRAFSIFYSNLEDVREHLGSLVLREPAAAEAALELLWDECF